MDTHALVLELTALSQDLWGGDPTHHLVSWFVAAIFMGLYVSRRAVT